MSERPLRVAIVYPGDAEVRRLATRENNRFAALFAAFAAHGVDAQPAVYDREQADELRDQLLASTARWCGSIRSTPATRALRSMRCCATSRPPASSSARIPT